VTATGLLATYSDVDTITAIARDNT